METTRRDSLPNHPDTLTTRNNIAFWTGRTGDVRGALELFAALLPDRERVLGADHPDTLAVHAWLTELRARGGTRVTKPGQVGAARRFR